MWECLECGRIFKNCNHEHRCGLTPSTIDEYILEQREDVRPHLMKINETIKKALPNAKEKISWRMPTYYSEKIIIQFAAFKNHIGINPGPEAIVTFAERLRDFKTSKGTIQIPYSTPLPVDLIRDISKWCLKNRN